MDDKTSQYEDIINHIMREKIRLNKHGIEPKKVFLECELVRQMRAEGYETIFGLIISEHESRDILLK